MSLPVTMYYCTGCTFEQGDALTWGIREYVLKSGVRIPVHHRIGWCDSCNGLAPIEDISSETRILEYREAQQALSRLERPGTIHLLLGLSNDYKEMERFYQDQMEDAFDALEMLATRKGPPHCLLCLSTQVHVPKKPAPDYAGKPEEWIWRHPGCGGQIRTRDHEDGLRLALRPSIHRYTSEGILINKEYVPGYSAPDSEYWDALSESNRNLRALSTNKLEGKRFFDVPKFLRKYAD